MFCKWVWLCVALIIHLQSPHVRAYEYCKGNMEKELCKDDGRHIVCYPEQIEQGAELLGHFPMTSKLKRQLLDLHNKCRDKIASGEETFGTAGKFPAAVRMRELIWDDELAYMAHVHAGRCKMQHDKCRNTKRFPYAGQNLCYTASSNNRTAKFVLESCVMDWYNEKDLVTDGEAAADLVFAGGSDNSGHFTAMINELQTRVGCSLTYCTNCFDGQFKHCYYLTCDYDYTNMTEQRIYLKGSSSASQCSDWDGSVPSKKYSHLCTNTGKVETKK